MTDYPIKVRWHNDSEALNKFLTRELEPLEGSPTDKREVTDDELDLIAKCVAGRQKTNIVINNEREHELVVNQLKSFANGIGHPSYGGKWADKKLSKAVNRRIQKLTHDGI